MTQQNLYTPHVKTKITIGHLQKLKDCGEKFAALTAYDYSFAKTIDECGIQVVLVGDSLGMTIQGHSSTLPVTLKDIIYHTKNVKAGINNALLMVDMPFGTYDTAENAYKNAVKIMQAGANMVKIEGKDNLAPVIKKLKINGIPVCAHLGLTPQFVNQLGGYKIQGKSIQGAQSLLTSANAAQEAGAKIVLLECVPSSLAQKISNQLTIPVIGIGAGHQTDAQILVIQDLIGLTQNPARFTKNYLLQETSIESAIKAFKQEVTQGIFPTSQHAY